MAIYRRLLRVSRTQKKLNQRIMEKIGNVAELSQGPEMQKMR